MKSYVLLLLSASGYALVSNELFSFDKAAAIIQDEVASYRNQDNIGRSLCDKYSCCNISSTESCNLSDMPIDETTLVLPGGKTRCIFSDSGPFSFQVIPGDSDKVMLYFQGGGACWNEMSTKLGFCTSSSSPQSEIGIFDRTNALNEFKDFTIVHVLYCSGDLFAGDVVRPYTDSKGELVVQNGLANAQSAIDWVLSQQQGGALSSPLSSLVTMGCSAGSIGAQLWSTSVAAQIPSSQRATIPDSYAGVFPPGSQGPLIKDFGFCDNGFLDAANYAKCMAGEITLQDINMESLRELPSVPMTFIQSKTDSVQRAFYVAVGATTPNTSSSISASEFYADVNAIFETYNENSNFVSYLVDGEQHCFSPSSVYFTADPTGPKANGANTKSPMMYEWTETLPLPAGGVVNSICDGVLQPNDVACEGRACSTTYCDDNLLPKEYVEGK